MWNLLRRALFMGNAETAHALALKVCQKSAKISPSFLRFIAKPDLNPTSVSVFGKTFLSPIGLAAGFDKNAEFLPALPDLGFGFAEIGTVTPFPQPGNEKPRLFRLLDEKNIWNSMGFNNDGAQTIARRLEKCRPHLPTEFRVGVNLGKNKNTELSDAHKDYAQAALPFFGLANYFVINVSSPNTAGLRELQEKNALLTIFNSVRSEQKKRNDSTQLLLKLAPETDVALLDAIISSEIELGIAGYILTNTLKGEFQNRVGGFSGKCLTEKSRELLIWTRARTQLPIISVGGIMDVDEASLRLQLGANLIQIYSSWIFEGPKFPGMISRRLRLK